MTEASYEKAGGKKSDLDIASEARIAEGDHGVISTAEVLIDDHRRSFVIKRFKDFDGITAQQHAERAFANHGAAKKIGLKVFPTYRLNRGDNSILMTSANNDEWLCVDGKDKTPGLEELGGAKMGKIENFEEVINALFAQAIKAANKGFTMRGDTPFFLVDRAARTQLDFVLGDVDNLESLVDHPNSNVRLIYNINSAAGAVQAFLDKNVHDPDPYTKDLRDRYNRIMTDLGLWNV